MKLYVIEMRIGPKKWQRLHTRYTSRAAAEAALPTLDPDGLVLPGQYRIKEI